MKNKIIISILLLSINACFSQQLLHIQNGAALTLQPGATILLQGGAVLENGSVLINNGTIALKNNGPANWIDNTVTSYSHGAGVLMFNNTGNSSIDSKNLFARIEMNTPLLTLNNNVSAGKWYLINGVIATGTNKAIANNSAQLAVEAGPSNPGFSNSWINGNLRRYINPAVVNTYIFPLGNNTQSNKVQLDNLNADPLTGITYLDASFGPKPGTDAGLIVSENGTPYTLVNNGGAWFFTPDAVPASGKFDLSLYFNGFTGLSDNTFGILQRPVTSSNAAEWFVPAGSSLPSNGLPGRTVADGYAKRNRISSFSQFAIGVASSALPITLTDFTATRLTKINVRLNWQTLTEQNNKGFEIERRLENETSFSGIDFTPSQAVNGNSSVVLNYLYNDINGYAGISYYRLKQIDLDNKSMYTFIRAVKGLGATGVSVLLWPNPSHGQFSIKIDGTHKSFAAFITDINGRVVQQLTVTADTPNNINGLSAGTYILSIPNVFGSGESFREKVVVMK